MKKALLIVLILVIALGASFMFTGCSSSPLPGTAWADYERLTYEMRENKEGGEILGYLVTEIETLPMGEHTLEGHGDRKFKIESNALRGMRYTQTVYKDEAQTIRVTRTVSIMRNFQSLASYSESYNSEGEVTSTATARLSGKNYLYKQQGGKEQSVKAGNALDNSLLYVILRVYDEIESAHTINTTLINPLNGQTASVRIASHGRTSQTFTFGEEGSAKTMRVIKATITRTSAPIGTSMEVWYSEKSFSIEGSSAENNNNSFYLPLKMIEEKVEYVLVSATTKNA
ncbi:MAG: hypothetical protein FWD49_01110 [Firmicutes bacterium]|nr:hypothetical protein [Bacillota bacterium]